MEQRTRDNWLGKWRLSHSAMLGIGLGVACQTAPTAAATRSNFLDATATVAQTAAKITGQGAPMATDYTKGKYVGFDTHTYPGDATMKAWKDTPGSPYKWVGYYL